jgi:uncharacterized protein YjiS (DUF1127 family)
MMTQPIQIFKNLTSETAPAGGNVANTEFSHEDRRLLELSARSARSRILATVLVDGIVGAAALYQRVAAALKADFKLRAAESQLMRMSDRELSDLGLCRADIHFAVRQTASEGVAPEFETQAAPAVAANRNTGDSLFWAGRA